MNFRIEEAYEILERTPDVLRTLLQGLSDDWIRSNEGDGTWNAFDIVGHYIHGEKTDWIPRAMRIIEDGESKPFEPFDRFAQLEESKGKTLGQLLDEFASLRKKNVERLKAIMAESPALEKTGMHPALGRVTLHQLLATWVVHDLNHIQHIVRVMSKRYKEDVGPWVEYLRILSL